MQASEDDEKPTHYALVVHGERLTFLSQPVHKRTRLTHKALRSSLMRTQYAHCIPVFTAVGTLELLDVLVHLHAEMTKKGAGMFNPVQPSQFSGVGGKRPRDTKTNPRDTFVAMLSCVVGVSPAKAQAIVAAFPSMSALLAATPSALADVQVGGRRVGPAVAKRVLEVLAM